MLEILDSSVGKLLSNRDIVSVKETFMINDKFFHAVSPTIN